MASLPNFGTMTTQTGLVAAGTNAGTIKTVTNIVHYAIDGILYAKAVTDNIATAAPTAAQLPTGWENWTRYSIGAAEAARTFYCVFALNAAGDVVMFQGSYEGQDLTFRGMPLVKGDGLIPDIPAGFAPFAVIKVANPASTAFVTGTTAWATAGDLTVTIRNLSTIPTARTL